MLCRSRVRWRRFRRDVGDMMPVLAVYLGVLSACLCLVYRGDRLIRPEPKPVPVQADPAFRRLADENRILRWELYRSRGDAADSLSEAERLRFELQAAIHGARAGDGGVRPATGFEVAPPDRIPPQQLPLP